jgi:rod shape determining protein RodA
MHASLLATQVKAFREPRQAILRIDPWLMVATLGLLLCSGFVLYGATSTDIPGQPYHYVDRQIAYGVVGLIFMLLLSRFDYSRTREWKAGLYIFTIGAILAVFALGGVTRGSKRWINLPFFNFQPSELGKVLLILALSAYIVDRVRRLQDRETTTRVMLLALLPSIMVVVQPDLGSAFVYLIIAATLLFVAGTKWTHFAVLGTLAVTAVVLVMVAAPAAGVHVLKPYQVDRLTAFLHPTDNPRKQGYQLNQSVTAIGAGQKSGRGDQATQTKLNFLPEHHTDFVFSVVGGEYGFVGAAVVL